MKIIRSAFGFVVLYVLLMVPTYILPYFGSNSTVTNAFAGAMGLGFLPQWWMHVWALAMMVLVAWMRGKWVDKGYLPAFAVAAGIFDMTPVLSSIPMIPTLFHLLAIILGAIGKEKSDNEFDSNKSAIISSLIITGIATLGIAVFMISAARTATSKMEERKAAYISSEKSTDNIASDKNIVTKEVSKKAANDNSAPFEEGQKWIGSYRCAQGDTPLILNVTKVSKSPDEKSYEVDAIFDFSKGTSNAGSYNIKGSYDVASGKIKFKPQEWISRPSGYFAVGMSGKVSNNTYSGKIDDRTCKSFSVSK